MLTLPSFEMITPESLDEAIGLLAEHAGRARVIAGGTDLLVNMKHRVSEPEVLINLQRVPGLNGVCLELDGGLSVGAMTPLAHIRDSEAVRGHSPALAQAAGLVASPQIQNMGTLGGNLCLDTRCVYINQTYFWRQALGFCLKKDGDLCHVIKGGQRCVAAQSSDTVPPLMILMAEVEIVGPDGLRRAPVESLYKKDGASHLTLAPDEIVTRVFIPRPAAGLRTTYQKYRVRQAIDFPVLSLAFGIVVDDQDRCTQVRAAATCMGSFPRRINKIEHLGGDVPLSDDAIDAIADQCQRQINPLDNITIDAAWRKTMIPTLTRRALVQLRGF